MQTCRHVAGRPHRPNKRSTCTSPSMKGRALRAAAGSRRTSAPKNYSVSQSRAESSGNNFHRADAAPNCVFGTIWDANGCATSASTSSWRPPSATPWRSANNLAGSGAKPSDYDSVAGDSCDPSNVVLNPVWWRRDGDFTAKHCLAAAMKTTAAPNIKSNHHHIQETYPP